MGTGDARALTGDGGGASGAAAPALEVAAGLPARPYAAVEWNRIPRRALTAWHEFVSVRGGTWEALWDMDTGVPRRIMGTGVAMPGSVSSPEAAERYALAFLARHMDLLAPGARVEDFVVVTNHLEDGMRTVGLLQEHRGLAVLGGQVSFRFKHDRLFVIGSEALPFVAADVPQTSPDAGALMGSALEWVSRDAGQAWPVATSGPYVLPVVRPGAVSYHTVMEVLLEARAPMGRWRVYVDAVTNEVVAREQILRFADGQVVYSVPRRYPRDGRIDAPARDTLLKVGAVQALSGVDGAVTWEGTANVNVETSVTGPLARVINDRGDPVTGAFTLAPGGTLRWDMSGDEYADAQLTGFIHGRVAKDFVRDVLGLDLAFLTETLEITVNINDSCNAFSDGFSINFFTGNGVCENTARLADVVYHEYGHVLHNRALLPGVGAFDGALSEGLSDYLSAAITGDPGMGRGFFRDSSELRHIDPDDSEARWPENISEVHFTGLIIAGALWDLRKALVAAHGEDAGVALANRLYVAALRRSVDIPSTYVEVLAADDDDGNLANGTPNECLINDTFGRLHGLRQIAAEHASLGAQPPEQDGYDVSLRVTGTSAVRCPGDAITSAKLLWGLREDGPPTNEVVLDAAAEVFSGQIPRQEDGSVVRYRVEVELADGGVWSFPKNLADPSYEFYVGDVVELYCTDFESDPFAGDAGWAREVLLGNDAARWEWGVPVSSGIDPEVAFSGTSILGTDIGLAGKDGIYANNSVTVVRTPVIDVGNYSDVRLHYRRWLTVEDALYDHATIYANETEVWRNQNTNHGNLHHLDDAWMFHDVPLSPGIFDGAVQVSFELASDQGLEFGGWNVDDVCIVANPSAICGDGVVARAEGCDNGADNSDTRADACRTSCRVAFCGDGVVDSNEACDDGNFADGDQCSSACEKIGDGGCGCAAGGDGGLGGGALLALLAFLLTRRRRGSIF